jgi:hypothetical protein
MLKSTINNVIARINEPLIIGLAVIIIPSGGGGA